MKALFHKPVLTFLEPEPEAEPEPEPEELDTSGLELRVEVRPSSVHGLGVFATSKISSGDRVCYYDGDLKDARVRVQVSLNSFELITSVHIPLFCALHNTSEHKSQLYIIFNLLQTYYYLFVLAFDIILKERIITVPKCSCRVKMFMQSKRTFDGIA